MVFTKSLRERIRRGIIRSSIRIWMRPHVKAGGRYPMDEGHVVVDSIVPIDIAGVSADLARESGFESVEALMEVARHGRGEQAYLIRVPLPAARRVGHSGGDAETCAATSVAADAK